VADEIAGAVELAQGKLGGRPFGVLRGRADLVLGVDDDGPGARALVRPEGGDLFGYGAREAVVRALAGDPGDRAPFGAPASAEELTDALQRVTARTSTPSGDGLAVVVPLEQVAVVAALALAHGWEVESRLRVEPDVEVRLRPATP
jgi:coenzyme F420-0:L-glutamate ligase/coenzyme F420-1:gamma-L-glutamate ligase